jgi:hypothetical protein
MNLKYELYQAVSGDLDSHQGQTALVLSPDVDAGCHCEILKDLVESKQVRVCGYEETRIIDNTHLRFKDE